MLEFYWIFMLFLSSFGTNARIQSAQSHYGVSCILLPFIASIAFSSSSCKEGWYYRCLGVEPSSLFFLLSIPVFFFRFLGLFLFYYYYYSIPFVKNCCLFRNLLWQGLEQQCYSISKRRIKALEKTIAFLSVSMFLVALVWFGSSSTRTSSPPPSSTPPSNLTHVRVASPF